MCSVISLKGDKVQAIARTMDFNISIIGASPINIKPGDKYRVEIGNYTFSKAIKGIGNVYSGDLVAIQEAINQDGLSFSLLYNVDNSMGKSADTTDQILIWPIKRLDDCATVQDIRNALKGKSFHGPEGMNATCHFFWTDAKGEAIVIEFHAGVPTVYECPLGVITNGPEYSWHLTNLRNYFNVSPFGKDEQPDWPIPVKTKIGHGNGFLGVPGGNGSPDRFIRLCLNKLYAKDVTDKNVVAKASNLIGLAHTLYGTQSSSKVTDRQTGEDETLWTTVKYMDGNKPMLFVRRVHDLNYTEVENYKEDA